MPRDVREIANAVLDLADEHGLQLTNLPLNKVVYFAHAWYLAQYSEPLVDSPFEAWQYGPVHPQIYRQFRRYGEKPIRGRLTRIDLATGRDIPVDPLLPAHERDYLSGITRFYGSKSAYWLVQKTHEPGSPWDQVWSASENRIMPGMIIPDSVTETYYRNMRTRAS